MKNVRVGFVLVILAAALGACGVQPQPAPSRVPAVAPLATGSPFEARIATGWDDVEERSTGSVKENSSTLQLVDDPKKGNQVVGLRFTDISIPQGADVTAAWIQFATRKQRSGAVSLSIHIENSANAARFFGNRNDVSDRLSYEAIPPVPWSPPAWTTMWEAGPDQRTPDLSDLVASVLDRPDWTVGNAMVFIVTGSGLRTAAAFEANPAYAALLHIEYQLCASPPCNQPPSVDAGLDQTATFQDPVALDATVTDDSSFSLSWQQVSGPGVVQFSATGVEDPTVTPSAAGVYSLRLTADDGEYQVSDDVTVAWLQPGSNPVVGIQQVNGVETGFDASGNPLPIPAIDPAGVAFMPMTGHLFVTDSEIEEANVAAAWAVVQANTFEASLDGAQAIDKWDLTTTAQGHNIEPTGAVFCPFDGHLYISNDQWPRSIFRYHWQNGAPVFDQSFSIKDYVPDPEGITCDPTTGRLYVMSGASLQVLAIDYSDAAGFQPVAVLDLVDTAGDPIGIPSDGEGIAFDAASGRLFIASRADKAIYEYTVNGAWIQTFSIKDFTGPDIKKPAGLGIGPSSADPSTDSFYVVDRRVDNDSNAGERDGALYEARIQRQR